MRYFATSKKGQLSLKRRPAQKYEDDVMHSISDEETPKELRTQIDSPRSEFSTSKYQKIEISKSLPDKENHSNRRMAIPQEFQTNAIPNQSTVDVKEINSTMKISDNPFDMLENKCFTTVKQAPPEKQAQKGTTSDDVFLSLLQKRKGAIKEQRPERKAGIFRKLVIRSKSEVIVSPKKYYKFPFDISLINDGTSIFNSIRNQFLLALSSVYSNYRRFGEGFKIVSPDGLFIYDREIKCSKSLSKVLKNADIGVFEDTDSDLLTVDDADKGLVYDLIMNLEIPKGKPIPFILSEFEFENGIIFRTKVEKGPVVRNYSKNTKNVEYTYNLEGPLFSSDFEFNEDVQIDYYE